MNFPEKMVIHEWRPGCWLRVSGDDAESFLQGQFTNDLRGMPPGGAVYGLWLTLKGKVLADSFVVREAGVAGTSTFWVGSYFSPAAAIRERLESHVIADDVVIDDCTAEWMGLSLLNFQGELACADAGDVVFRGRRSAAVDMEWVFRVARRAEVRGRVAGWAECGVDEMTRRRIEGEVPAVPTDIGPGDLPGEGGLEAAAISYSKGCYLGQEVMARLKSMGQVRRRLRRVEGLGEPPTGGLPAAIFAGGRKVGELRSAARRDGGGWVGLAMLTLIHMGPGSHLSLGENGEATVSCCDAL